MNTEETLNTDTLDVHEVRRMKLAKLRSNGFNFPNNFHPKDHAEDIFLEYDTKSKEELSELNLEVVVAGRIVLRRVMGKASFFHIQDITGRIQIYIRSEELPQEYLEFQEMDLGDIVGVKGILFKTKTQELSIHASSLQLLTKSLQPLPDKFHGLTDPEQRFRKRYVDLIANENSKITFIIRSKIIKTIRKFMDQHSFLEVETPMMHPIPGGALAKPFVTHHNALDQTMYLRIAPELYLKRLIVGGFEKVYEINRNFRNEGLSTRHNPEFTMIEFYQAYADYKMLMDYTEKLLKFLAKEVLGKTEISYQGHHIDFALPFAKMSVKEAICNYLDDISIEDLEDYNKCRQVLDSFDLPWNESLTLGQLQMLIFEEKVEHLLISPTFITEYPTDVSPLARRNNENPEITDRFELFIAGRELANGFSELNDAEDQAERFRKQADEKDAGNHEAMHYDADYVEALEYGMPPTAGEGIGIDRLVMLFTDAASIREVILFPQLRLS